MRAKRKKENAVINFLNFLYKKEINKVKRYNKLVYIAI